MKSRRRTYKEFKTYRQEKDERSMDEICVQKDDEFKLQVQQLFLKDFITTNAEWKSLLLYHEIGSGKTCTAITVAEAYIQNTLFSLLPSSSFASAATTIIPPKVTVILPARLKNNFLDELISPCGFHKYISQEDFILYKSATTPEAVKAKIKLDFMNKINKYYNIMSYEAFTNFMFEHRDNIIQHIQEWTKNNLIIIDEVHNIFSTKYDINVYNKIYQSGKIEKKPRGFAVILMNLIVRFCDDSCRLLYLTATPIFNNLDQLYELVKIMSPEVEISKKSTLHQLIYLLRGKVSYFPGVSKKAYPHVNYIYHNILISDHQDVVINAINEQDRIAKNRIRDNDGINEANENAFLLKQRLAELSILDKAIVDSKHVHDYAPKLELLLHNLENSIGKQVIYTNFVEKSIEIIEVILKAQGFFNILDVMQYIGTVEWEKYKFRVYSIWTGNTRDQHKHLIKSIMNSKSNLFGENIKVVIGSPSIKEGISFLHVQDMHILDPVWNMSAKKQVEGRVIRYCSHIDIDEKQHMPLKRHVNIHYYKLVHKKNGLVQRTADEIIYDEIIPAKYKLVQSGEKYLKKVAIDHHLFKRLYTIKEYSMSSESSAHTDTSYVSFTDDDSSVQFRNRKESKKCPKHHMPIDNKCPEKWELKSDELGNPCCFKMQIDKSKGETSCPVYRRPVEGKCNIGYELRVNKHNMPCCYKTRTLSTLIGEASRSASTNRSIDTIEVFEGRTRSKSRGVKMST